MQKNEYNNIKKFEWPNIELSVPSLYKDIRSSFIKDLFGVNGFGGTVSIGLDQIHKISLALHSIYKHQESNTLPNYFKEHDSEELHYLILELRNIADFIEDGYKRHKEDWFMSVLPINKIDRHDRHKLRFETLGDMVQSLLTIRQIIEENLTDSVKLEFIKSISSHINWLIDEGLEELVKNKLNDEEIEDFLTMKARIRMYEAAGSSLDGMFIGGMYRSFTKDKLQSEQYKNPPQPNCLYIFGNSDLTCIKIGITGVSVEERFKHAQAYFREKTENQNDLLFILKEIENKNSREIESYLKAKFQKKRIPGWNSTEWFHLEKDDLVYLLNGGYKKDAVFMMAFNEGLVY